MGLGQWISEQRTKRGWSQQLLGELLDVSQGTISHWERDKRDLSEQEHAQLKRIFSEHPQAALPGLEGYIPKRRGRPPGSRNAPKDLPVQDGTSGEAAQAEAGEEPPSSGTPSSSVPQAAPPIPKRRGRPPGSRNKPRASEPAITVKLPKRDAPAPSQQVSEQEDSEQEGGDQEGGEAPLRVQVPTRIEVPRRPESEPSAPPSSSGVSSAALPSGAGSRSRQSKPSDAVPKDGLLTPNQLTSHLWEAANILRGSPVDRTDWKSYILPMLFFKRICDQWDEERAAMLAEYGTTFDDEHRFQVPEEAHWSKVRAHTTNVGKAISAAMRKIEAANQKHLYGIFGDAQWSNKERLPDELLNDLIDHFSLLAIGNSRVASDVMGDAYEFLIKKFAVFTNKTATEFYTPRSVVRMMVDILAPREGETVYDPACGTGGMLLAAVEHVRDRGGDPRTFFGRLYGQEKNLTTSSVARMNLLLHGIEDFNVERGDTLRSPIFVDPSTGGLATFDVVLANPPFSLEKWGREDWESDVWGRKFAGLPPESNGDMAWVQHMVTSMAARVGRMAVVLPQGALFRGGVEGQIRQHLLKADLIEAVIGLAPNLFYGTGLAACVLILKRSKPAERKGKVLIVDASAQFKRGRAQNFLEPEHAEQIQAWVQAFEDVEDHARVVGLAELEKEGWTLNISRYVMPPIGADIPPLHEAVAAFKEALSKCREAEDQLRQAMLEGGWLA